MKKIQKLKLTALVLTLGALVAASPAFAGWRASKPSNKQSANLGTIQLANTGEEPAAVGEASLKNVTRTTSGQPSPIDPYPWIIYQGTLVVKCQSLTPGATYGTPVGSFTASFKGTGSISGEVSCEINVGLELFQGFDGAVTVWRINEDGSETPVLWGYFNSWPE